LDYTTDTIAWEQMEKIESDLIEEEAHFG